MPFSNNEISTYLFCAQLSQTKTTPLTILEWNAVVKSLSEHKLQPESLLTMTSSELLNVLTQATASQKSKILKKIEDRQKLGISMLELEETVHQGYGVMFRSQMPACLKKLTQKFIPPFFYYAGDPSILYNRTLGVVGARNANSDELSLTAAIAKEAAQRGIAIISGGAKGVDTTAVDAVLESGGKAVVFPSEGLAKWIKKSSIRQYIMNGQLILMSTQKLEAPFTGSYAMQRNKYIHAPSDAVLIGSSKISGSKSSGTWEGVLENLKYEWSPLYVIGQSEGAIKLLDDGNAKLFSSLDDIYHTELHVEQDNRNNIKTKLNEFLQLAFAEGMSKEMIEKIISEQLDEYFNETVQVVHEKTQELIQSKEIENLEEVEQLCIDDML